MHVATCGVGRAPAVCGRWRAGRVPSGRHRGTRRHLDRAARALTVPRCLRRYADYSSSSSICAASDVGAGSGHRVGDVQQSCPPLLDVPESWQVHRARYCRATAARTTILLVVRHSGSGCHAASSVPRMTDKTDNTALCHESATLASSAARRRRGWRHAQERHHARCWPTVGRDHRRGADRTRDWLSCSPHARKPPSAMLPLPKRPGVSEQSGAGGRSGVRTRRRRSASWSALRDAPACARRARCAARGAARPRRAEPQGLAVQALHPGPLARVTPQAGRAAASAT